MAARLELALKLLFKISSLQLGDLKSAANSPSSFQLTLNFSCLL